MLSTRKLGKVGELNMTLIVEIAVVLILAIVVILVITKKISSTNAITDQTYEQIKLCNEKLRNQLGNYDKAVYDTDDDGILDPCDICVAPEVDGKRSQNSADFDSDGIPDACDSKTGATQPYLGFFGDAVKIECRKQAKARGGLQAEISEVKGFTTCHLK